MVTLNLNVSEEAVKRLRAYANAHGLDEGAALEAILEDNADPWRKPRNAPFESLMRFRATHDLKELEGAFDDVRDRSLGREVDL